MIIPAFEVADVIERAIQSVQNQSHTVSEIIVVDDGSGDTTTHVVRELAKKDPRIRLFINQKNLGPGPSRNLAWDVATSDFVAFLDADDTWEEDKIRIQLEWFDRHPDRVLCATDHRVVNKAPKFCSDSDYATYTVTDLLVKNRFTTPSVMLRRDISERFDERLRLSEDYQLWIRLAARYGGVSRLNRQLTVLHKPIFGVSGLSSKSILMFRFEIKAFVLLREMLVIGWVRLLMVMTWSTLKFVRRGPIVFLRQRRRS